MKLDPESIDVAAVQMLPRLIKKQSLALGRQLHLRERVWLLAAVLRECGVTRYRAEVAAMRAVYRTSPKSALVSTDAPSP